MSKNVEKKNTTRTTAHPQTKWIITTTDSAWDIIPNAEHIERNDYLDLPEDFTDFDAAKLAKKKGVKLIDDIEGVYKDFYVDTPKNRSIIENYIALNYKEKGRELVGKDKICKVRVVFEVEGHGMNESEVLDNALMEVLMNGDMYQAECKIVKE